jgi:hypothetical protein
MSTATPGDASGKPGDTSPQVGRGADSKLANLQLQALSFSEKAILDAYTEALKNGLSAVADANGTLITASLAIATLYGALIGLVSPKNQASPIIVILPMIPLVGAFLAAVFGKTRGISFDPADTTTDVRNNLTGVIRAQRWSISIAVPLLAIGLIAGGLILTNVYGGKTPTPSPKMVTVYLTGRGQRAISSTCRRHATSVTGSARTPIAWRDIAIVPTLHSPCAGQTLELTPKEVTVIK